ncbi:hypothetical protein V8F33_006823 [Rhypophila sp. PSN 637]
MASNDTATALDFEHLLDFGDNNATRTAKPLACARCHGQKLRCVRGKATDGHACDRCLAAGLDCIGRRPQRMGRPPDKTLRRRKSRSKQTRLRNSTQTVPHPPITVFTDVSEETSELPSSATPPETDCNPSTPYTSSLTEFELVGTPSGLLPGLQDLANLESLFPGGIDVGSFDFQQLSSEVMGGNPPPVHDSDPIEHLSQLHLEL